MSCIFIDYKVQLVVENIGSKASVLASPIQLYICKKVDQVLKGVL